MNNNIGVAVLDTGIYKHIDFGNRIIAFKDFINNQKYFVFSSDDGKQSGYIWDDGSYIFNIYGDLNKKELLNLCKTLKVKK